MPPSGDTTRTAGTCSSCHRDVDEKPTRSCTTREQHDDVHPEQACTDHKPVQHRDGKPPWCKECGLTAAGVEPKSRLGQAAGQENARDASARDEESARREALRTRYGQPDMVDAAEALSVLGDTHIAPADVVAFRYRDQEAADAYAASNLEHYGHPSLGTYVVPDGVVGVIDLSEALRVLGRE